MQTKSLIGLEVNDAVGLLNGYGVGFKLTFYKSEKTKDGDRQLVIAARDGTRVELIVSDFRFGTD